MIVTPFTHEPTNITVWDVRTNGNVFPGLTLWDVHKNGNIFLGLTVCDIHTDGNVFLGFTVWDVHTYGNDFLRLPCGMYIPTEMPGFRCLTRSHTAPAPRRAYSRQFLGCVGRTPYHTHSLGDGSKCRRGKGLKTICLGPTRTSVT